MDYFVSEIIMQLASADDKLLLLLNGMHTPFLDRLMWMVSDRWVWAPFYVLLAYLVVRRDAWRPALLCILLVAVAVGLTDHTCAFYIRPALQRLRPSAPDNPVSCLVHIVNGYRGGRYGFPSCHAANTFALAVFLSLHFRSKPMTLLMFSWSLLVSLSRIYLGVHYPGDVLGGMFVGGLYALLFWGVYCLACRGIPLIVQKTIVT